MTAVRVSDFCKVKPNFTWACLWYPKKRELALIWDEDIRESRHRTQVWTYLVQLGGFSRPGRHCCCIFIGREAVAGTLITLNTVEVAHCQGWETECQGLITERSSQGTKEDTGCLFFYHIFCLLSRGSDSSRRKANADPNTTWYFVCTSPPADC